MGKLVASAARMNLALTATLALCAGLGASGARAEDAPASPPVVIVLDYKLDAMGVVEGGLDRRGRHLDDLNLSVDLDLDRAVGWAGVTAHLDLSSTGGHAPSEGAGALQGVDNIEVGAHRGRLYQAWIEAAIAEDRANLRVGFNDLSGEFAVIDASGLLLNPSFGMAAEFAASGAAAYPSTAFGARLRVAPTPTTYVQLAVANAQAAVPGDAGGPDFSFDMGEVLVAEAGWSGRGKLAVGYWRLSERQDDLFALNAAGDPRARIAQGIYALAEQTLNTPAEGGRTVTGFVRAGAADGHTTAFRGSVQAGVLVQPAFAGRPDSSLSVGLTQAWIGSAYRTAARTAGIDLNDRETVLELTYSDQLTPKVRLQPDLQYIHRPGGDRAVDDAIVAGLRLEIGF